MGRFDIPVWINILSVVAGVVVIYLLAKWNAPKQGLRMEKGVESKPAEVSPRGMEKDPAAGKPRREEPVLKKAA
jgi:hypothetical protein